MPMSESEAEEIRLGTWEKQCYSMELIRADGKKSYKGTGRVALDRNRRLAFTLLCPSESDGYADTLIAATEENVPAGDIIPSAYWYELRFCDEHGQHWVSAPTLNVGDLSGATVGVVIRGTVAEVTRRCVPTASHGASKRHFFHIRYLAFTNIVEFPCNASVETRTSVGGAVRRMSARMCVSKADSDVFAFELLRDQGYVQFCIHGKQKSDKVPIHAHERFIEALQFVLGQPFDWEAMEEGYEAGGIEITVRPRPVQRPPASITPPLAFTLADYHSGFWDMYRAYLAHILPCVEEGWHPISRRVLTLQYGLSGLWPVQLLTAGVEVEGLLNDEFDATLPVSKELRAAIDETLRLVNEHVQRGGSPITPAALQRIRSSLGVMGSSSSARNRLTALADKGIVRMADVEAWHHIRNKAAHAVASETEVSQENIQRLYKVLVLFYHMVFYLIGYSGTYTDYGTPDWPPKHYPA